jgi:uncharacterized protein (UPF0332 family)
MEVAKDSFKLLLNNGDLQGAANRLYYAVFYALSTLALSLGHSFSKHGSLIGWFNREYVITDRIPRSFGRFVNTAWKLRSHGDYEFVVDLNAEQLTQMVNTLRDFIQRISDMLQSDREP